MYKVLVIGWNKQNLLYKYFISLQFYPDPHQHHHHHHIISTSSWGFREYNE